MHPDRPEHPAAQDRYLRGMRESKPEVCWRIIDNGERVCILDRGHNDGVHERDEPAAAKVKRESEIRALAAVNGRRLMGDGHYSTVMLGWSDIQMLLTEIDRLRIVEADRRLRDAS